MTDPVSPSAPVAWRGPGIHPHDYHPDIMAMGDCSVCGHTYEAHQPAAASPAPSMVGLREKVELVTEWLARAQDAPTDHLGVMRFVPICETELQAIRDCLALLAREGV